MKSRAVEGRVSKSLKASHRHVFKLDLEGESSFEGLPQAYCSTH